MISSGEDDDKDLEYDDEDDIISEDKKLLQDVRLTADDIVIVATFKLPLSVFRDPVTGAWRTRQTRSMLYSTLFKLREKKKMVKIICIGWPSYFPQNDLEAQEITDLLRPYGCYPVFFDQDTIE